VKEARLKNFWFLHKRLGQFNQLNIDSDMPDVPFSYPFLPANYIEKKLFYKEGFFIPSLWLDPSKRATIGFEKDKDFGLKLMPVPTDHRYTPEDLEPIAELLILNSRQ
jgi:hypothetical protein